MDRNVLNDIVNILCANIERVHGVIITNAYGMFRTKDINLMTINEVYIGGIQGLNTRTIAHSKEEPYDSTQTCYDIVLCAYKRLLKSNIIALADNAKLLVPTK